MMRNNLNKLAIIIIYFFILMGCQSHIKPNLSKEVSISLVKSVKLQSGDEVIGFVKKLQIYNDNFFIVDPFHARKTMFFDSKGDLKYKYGGQGEGPGESPMLMNAVISDNKVILYGNQRVNIFNLGDNKCQQFRTPIRGICCNMYPADDGSFYILSLNRYNKSKDTIYKYNTNLKLLNSFSPYDTNIPKVLDTFFPQASMCQKGEYIYQVFNYKYEVIKFNKNGYLVKVFKLKSPFYVKPDLSEHNIKGHYNELKYRASFTQLTGIFSWSKGFIVELVKWKNQKECEYIYEYWSNDFRYLGYTKVEEEAQIMNIYKDQIVILTQKNDYTQLDFFKINLE